MEMLANMAEEQGLTHGIGSKNKLSKGHLERDVNNSQRVTFQ